MLKDLLLLGAEGVIPGRYIVSLLRVFKQFTHFNGRRRQPSFFTSTSTPRNCKTHQVLHHSVTAQMPRKSRFIVLSGMLGWSFLTGQPSSKNQNKAQPGDLWTQSALVNPLSASILSIDATPAPPSQEEPVPVNLETSEILDLAPATSSPTITSCFSAQHIQSGDG